MTILTSNLSPRIGLRLTSHPTLRLYLSPKALGVSEDWLLPSLLPPLSLLVTMVTPELGVESCVLLPLFSGNLASVSSLTEKPRG